MRLPFTTLTLLLITTALAATNEAQKQQPEVATAPSSVPGHAFHQWRTALINTKFSSSGRSDGASTTITSITGSTFWLGQQQQHHHQQEEQWVNIVATRESLSKLKGPAARTTTHPAAARRLRIARALIARASSDADAAAKTDAAAAAADAAAAGGGSGAGDATAAGVGAAGVVLPKPPGQFDTATDRKTVHHRGRALQLEAAATDKQQQQSAGGTAATPTSSSSSSTAAVSPSTTAVTGRSVANSDSIIAAGGSSTEGLLLPGVQQSISGTTDVELVSQLTALMRQQPYKPLKTDAQLLEATLMHFVHRGPQGRLYVQAKPWLLRGMDVPEALLMAGGGPVQRSQLLYLLDRAQTLGLNTMRFRAFADGAPGIGSAVANSALDDSSSSSRSSGGAGGDNGSGSDVPSIALQPAPGILNGTLLRGGLEWLVHECSLRGIRLLPVLTNGGSAEGGGMKQYIDWIDPALTITDFYTNDTVKSVFLDYVAAMLGHVNSLTSLPLREDPVIMGWQLAEDASHPGQPSSQTLLAWLRQLGVFIKERAPHQLLMSGVLDLFGHNSPHHLQHNPYAQVFAPASSTPHHYEPRCHGVDFWLHNQLAEMDAAVSGVFPDAHLACSAACKLDWARQWVRAHLRDALRMNKPLILGGIGALRPQSWRLKVLQLVREEVERALQRGHPIGGFILSGLSHPDMQDTSGWATYYASKGVHRESAPLHNLNMQAVADVKWRHFMNYDAFLTCSAAQTRGTSNDKGEASNTQGWVDGWEDVVREVAAISKLPSEGPNSAR